VYERDAMRVFVTGASSGLGEGLALHYAQPGNIIGLCARRAPMLAELARSVEAAGARPIVLPADVADTAAMATAAADFTAQAGGVDLVIANAGVGIPSQVLEGKSEPVAKLMRINVIGVTNTVLPFVPVMVQQRSGVLVAMGSLAGQRGLPGRAAYSASKAAVATFMDALRQDLRGTGVHAMTLCPGFVHTPLTAKLPGKLPFVIERDEAVARMAAAIERHERRVLFPWQVKLLGQVLRWIPERWLHRISPPARPADPSSTGG
jgi:short-subunit dehydrogenase